MGKRKPHDAPNMLNNASANDVRSSRPHRRLWMSVRIVVYLSIAFTLVGFTLSYRLIFSNAGIVNTEKTPIFQQLKQLISADEKLLTGELDDRVNVLLIGIGGPGHAGSYLADTIILLSYRPSTDDVALLSIPRDLFVPIPGFGWRKINNAVAFGYLKGNTNGEELLVDIVQNITGLTIPYYARVDFEAFRKIIDAVGGIEVDVDRAFSDYEYPDYNYGYQPISFDAGPQTMDGETALEYVRSRHGTNGEGSDFARALRQQKVLTAVRSKVFSLGTFLNPSTILEMTGAIGDHAKTNMEIWEILKLGHLARSIDLDSISNVVLDSDAHSPLYATTTVDGAYILRPRAGLDDFSEVAEVAVTMFDAPGSEQVTIDVLNGTSVSGLALSAADMLKGMGYTMSSYGNALRTDVERTVIYDLSLGRHPTSLKSLRKIFNANVATSLPVFLREERSFDDDNAPLNLEPDFTAEDVAGATDAGTDFILILGTDAAPLVRTLTTP